MRKRAKKRAQLLRERLRFLPQEAEWRDASLQVTFGHLSGLTCPEECVYLELLGLISQYVDNPNLGNSQVQALLGVGGGQQRLQDFSMGGVLGLLLRSLF